ncbi:MAG: 5'-nucleotidase, lipoprotein e(P4) family [Salibacteraceae bacterium]
MKKIIYLVAVFITITSCTEPDKTEEVANVETGNTINSQEHTMNSVLFHQTAAEYKALCYQTYNFSKLVLENKLKDHAYPYEKPPAIVMDLDETVVDNSFYNAQLLLDNEGYTNDSWKEWSDLSKAGAVPGAIEFIKSAQELGVKVMFISNRRSNELSSTMNNVISLGVNNVDSSNFLLREEEGSKMARRSLVSEENEIVMLFGDNLADFMEIFDKESNQVRNDLVDSLSAEFGNRFVVLPNVLYGEWEGSLYDYKYDWNPSQKDSIRRSYVVGYK